MTARLSIILVHGYDPATIKTWFEEKCETAEDFISCSRTGWLRRWCLTYHVREDVLPHQHYEWLLTHIPAFVNHAVFETTNVELLGNDFRMVMRGE